MRDVPFVGKLLVEVGSVVCESVVEQPAYIFEKDRAGLTFTN
jgi:hypothetical protein